jgi:FAD/FMN-containing dehydrogenase
MNEGQARRGRHLRTELSVPLSQLSDFVARAEAAVMRALPETICVSYGSVGDENVLPNVLPAPRVEIAPQLKTAKAVIHDVLAQFGASINAEHGIGRLK